MSTPSPQPVSGWFSRLRPWLPALALALFGGLVLLALDRLTGELRYAELLAEVRAVSPGALALAGLFTALSFVALAGYDAAGLAYLGVRLPLRTLASRARIAHAKIAAGSAADVAARMAVQAHGAMGMTWEVDLHFYLKRAFALNYAWGTPAVHSETVMERVAKLRTGPDATFSAEIS